MRELLLLGGGLVLLVLIGVAIIDWSARWIAVQIPFSYEQQLSEDWSDQLDNGSEQVRDYLQTLADSLSRSMQLPAGMSVTAHYSDDPTVNAYATLGGHMVVFRGLIEQVPDENALAMVIAHEIAHIKHRDPIVAMGRGVLVGTALAVVGGASGDDMAARLLGGTGLLTGLHFSREQETDADIEALAALHLHYGHVGGATTLFEYFDRQEQEGGRALPELFNTHPRSEGRVQALRSLAARHGWPLDGERRSLPVFMPKLPEQAD